MITINQALFGYSNGHHLLKSSVALSNTSLKILEPLSDLSGSGMHIGFDEYITGYPLVGDQYYALSKTWYATEMTRPGCVWTHTLLFDFAAFDELSQYSVFDIDNMFIKPTVENDLSLEKYSQKLYIEKNRSSNHCQSLAAEDVEYKDDYFTIHILRPFFESMEPIIISAESAEKYNVAMEFLLLRAGKYFFKNISFCTGSLSNRTLDRKPLDIQVVPAGLSKNVYRSNSNAQLISESKNISSLQWLDLIYKNFFKEEDRKLKNFVLEFGEKYIERKYLKAFAEAYITNSNNCDESNGVHYLSTITNAFESNEKPYIVNKAFSLLFFDRELYANASGKSFSDVLMSFCISSQVNNWNDIITNTTLNHIVESILKEDISEAQKLFKNLISYDINEFGERIILTLASLITPKDLQRLIGANGYESNILVRSNWRLALSPYLWVQSLNSQVETLKCLDAVYRNSDTNDKGEFKRIIQVIFSTSKVDIYKRVYDVFGSLAIEAFSEWGEHILEENRLSHWSKLCKYDLSISINWLIRTQNPKLFHEMIKVIDNYDRFILSVNKDIWINLYNRFCVDKYDNELGKDFAQFILPIIITSNDRYPMDIAYFAFKNVHDLLAKDQMDYLSWEKLSELLPEVAWYNSWDKCKRLRKAAIKKQYYFDVYDGNYRK